MTWVQRVLGGLIAAATWVGPVMVAGGEETKSTVTTVFLVRHAERANSTDASPLSFVGEKRAQALSHVLKSVELSAVFATVKLRAQQTALPVAQAAGLQVSTYDDVTMLAETIRTRFMGSNVLVVGHSNTLDAIAQQLSGGSVHVDTGEEYDNLLVLLLGIGERTSLFHRLRYGSGP